MQWIHSEVKLFEDQLRENNQYKEQIESISMDIKELQEMLNNLKAPFRRLESKQS
jgi:hypothetical protein